MLVLTKTRREALVTVQSKIMRLSEAEETLATQLDAAGATGAAERLRAVGLPTRRNEAYHYTDLKALLRVVPDVVGADAGGEIAAFSLAGACRLRIVNGVVQPGAEMPEGVVISQCENSILPETDDRLVEVNRALAPRAVQLDISGAVTRTIVIEHVQSGAAGHCGDAVVVNVAAGGIATIVESFSSSDGGHLGNHSAQVDVAAGASLLHVGIDLNAADARHFATNSYELAADAKLRTMVIHAGSVLARTQVFARFSGAGAHADFAGLNLVDEGQHADMTLEVDHAVANTTSTELYKSVARGKARAVVQGRIVVRKDAQKTDAQMMVQGLMLCEEADIFAKPELEIFADDVVCGHGATCGTLDEQSLFYLMSRGIPRQEAESLLVKAFMQSLFDPIESEHLETALIGVTDDWLTGALVKAAQ